MPLARIRIADTEAIAKYTLTKTNGAKILQITGLNHKKGRRAIKLDQENRTKLEKMLSNPEIKPEVKP